MKRKYGFVAILLFCMLVVGTGLTGFYQKEEKQEEEGQLKVVTSFYPMYIAAMNVIGDAPGVTLENLSEPQTGCLHDYQLTPADMKLLSSADVFIINGGGIESFLSEVAESYPSLTIIDASEYVELLSSEGEDETMGTESGEEETAASEHEHDHGDENAHAWMNIEDYQIQVQTMADALAEKDPARADIYAENTDVYLEKLEDLKQEADEVAGLTAGEDIVIFHEAYAYIAQEYGMHVAYMMDLDEERQVSAGEVADVVSQVEDNGVKIVLAEELYGKDMGDMIERETDAKVYYLDTLVRGEYDADSYLNAMRSNIRILKEAFTQ